MEKGSSILGPMEKRKKIDLRLPLSVTEKVKELADILGVPANAVYAMAVSQYVSSLSTLQASRVGRVRALEEMEKIFQNIVFSIRKSF